MNGNLPDNNQIDSTLAYAEDNSPIDLRKLSPAGQQLIEDFRDIIGTSREIIAAKNPDELIQDTIYASAHVDNQGFRDDVKAGGEAGGADPANKDKFKADGKQAASEIKTLVKLFLSNGEVRKLVKDAGVVGRQLFATGASRAADRAAPSDEQLQQVDSTAQDAPQSAQAQDPQRGMTKDERKQHAKQKASQAGGQIKSDAKDTVNEVLPEERRQRFIQRLKKAVVELQEDPQYEESMSWLLDTFDKYKAHGSSVTKGAMKGAQSDGQVQSVTEDWITILERFANNTPLTGVRNAVDQLYTDANNDPQLHQWWSNVSKYVRAVLLKPGYILDDSCDQQGQQLVNQGRDFFQGKYKGHWDNLFDQLSSWLKEFDQDELNHQFGEDWHRLTKDLLFDGDGKLTFKPELWQDIRQVILPSLIKHLGYFPIPRAEYTDDKLDLIVDNVVLSGPNLFPNTIEFDNRNRFSFSPYQQIGDKSYNTVRISLGQIQADIRDVKFAFRKKSGFPKLSDSGFADVVVSGNGISVDIMIEVIRPTRRDEVYRIGHVKTDVDELSFKLRDTKHDTLYKFIKPAATSAIKKAISKAINDAIRNGLEFVDEQLVSVRNTMADAKDTDGVTRQEALKQLYAHKKRSAEANKEKAKAKKEERNAQFAIVTSPDQELFAAEGVDRAQDSITNKALYQQHRARQGPTWHSDAFTIVQPRERTMAGTRHNLRADQATQNFAAGGAGGRGYNSNDPRYQQGGVAGQQDPRYAQQGQHGHGTGAALGAGAVGAAAGAAGGYAAGRNGQQGQQGQQGTGAVFDPKTGKYENQGNWDKDHVKHAAGTAAGGAKFLPSADGANYVATHRSEDRTVHPDGTYTTHGGIETKTLIDGKTGKPIKEKTSILDMNTGRYVEQPGSEIFFDSDGRPKGGSGFAGQQGQRGQTGQTGHPSQTGQTGHPSQTGTTSAVQQGSHPSQTIQGQRGTTDHSGHGAGTAAALGAGAGAAAGAAGGAAAARHGDKGHQAVYDKDGNQISQRDGRVDPHTGQFVSNTGNNQQGQTQRGQTGHPSQTGTAAAQQGTHPSQTTQGTHPSQTTTGTQGTQGTQGRYNDQSRSYSDRDQSGRGYNKSGHYDDHDDHHDNSNRNRNLGAGAAGAAAGAAGGYAAGRHRDHDDDDHYNQSGRNQSGTGRNVSGTTGQTGHPSQTGQTQTGRNQSGRYDDNSRGYDRDDSRQNYPGSGRDNRATGAVYSGSGDRDRDYDNNRGDRGYSRQTGVRGQDDYDDHSGRNALLGAGAGGALGAGAAYLAAEHEERRRNPDGSWSTVRGSRAAGAYDSQGRPIAQQSQVYDPQSGRYIDDSSRRRIGSNAGSTPLGISGRNRRYDDDDDDYNRGYGRNQRGGRYDDDDDDYNRSRNRNVGRNVAGAGGWANPAELGGRGGRYDDDDYRGSGYGSRNRGGRYDDDDDDYNRSSSNRRALGAGALGAGAGAAGGYAAGRRRHDDDDDYDNRRNYPGSGQRGTAAFGRDNDRYGNQRGYDDRYDQQRYGQRGSGFGSSRYDDDDYRGSGFSSRNRGGRYDDDDYNQSSYRNQRGTSGRHDDDDYNRSSNRNQSHTGRNAALGAGAGALAGGAYGASRRRDDDSDDDQFYDAHASHTPATGGTGTGSRAQQRADEVAQQHGIDSTGTRGTGTTAAYGSSGRGQRGVSGQGGDSYTGDSAADYPHDTSGRYSSSKQETTVVGQPQRLHNRHGGGATGTEAVAPYGGDDDYNRSSGNRSGTVGSYLDDDRNRDTDRQRTQGRTGAGGYGRSTDDKYGNALDGTDHRDTRRRGDDDDYSSGLGAGGRGGIIGGVDLSSGRNIVGSGGWADPSDFSDNRGTFGRGQQGQRGQGQRDWERFDDDDYSTGQVGRGNNQRNLANIAGVAGGAALGGAGGYAAGRRGNRYDDDDDDYNRSGSNRRNRNRYDDDDDYNYSGSRGLSGRDQYGSSRGGAYGSEGPIVIAGGSAGPGYEERFVGVIDDARLGEDQFSSHSQRANPNLGSSGTQASPTSRGAPVVTGAYDSYDQGSGPTGSQVAHQYDRAKERQLHQQHERNPSGAYGAASYPTASSTGQTGGGTKEYSGQGASRTQHDNTGDLTGRSGHGVTGSAADKDLSGRSAGSHGLSTSGTAGAGSTDHNNQHLRQGEAGYGAGGQQGIHTGPTSLRSGAGTGAGIGATGAGTHVAGTGTGTTGQSATGQTGTGQTGTTGTSGQHIPGAYHESSPGAAARANTGTTAGATSGAGTSTTGTTTAGATTGATSAGTTTGTSGGLSGMASKLTGNNNNTAGTTGTTGDNNNSGGLLQKAKDGVSNLVSSDKK